jgi:hypothetical protein
MKIVARFILNLMLLGTAGIATQSLWMRNANAQTENTPDAAPREASNQPLPELSPRPEGVILKRGTEIKLAFAQSLSSKHATIGEKVELRVIEDVAVGQVVVVPAGARAIGTVVQGKKNEKYGNSKDLAISVDYVVFRGTKVRLTGEKQQKAKTNVGLAAAATVGLGVSGLMIYMSQREAWIREGTPAAGYVAEDVAF